MATDVTTTSNEALKNLSTAQTSSSRATTRGTAIVKKGAAMDQNSFLKILSAELSNQDPTAAKDGTEFVAQMAQFAGLEQMSNLNTNITFSNSTSLVGKMVAFDSYDDKGVQYGGTVQAVYKDAGKTYMAVQLTDGTTKDFPADTLSDVIDASSATSNYLNNNTVFSAAINLMGKQVTTRALGDAKVAYTGTVKSVAKTTTGINLTISYQEDSKEVTKDISYDDISKVG
ncbi:flagellar hook capping FlgD N-terminal domain-containing protein [Clostridium estertheticum]|uniref:flagellar hook capping FlgD N-terminal domain-containing protein n=1 Tax=Clostridium estertheticum TaxID=238834 RepID=UPI001C7D7563|nr:flagellar hook capping FlgD N-terminal domain-containing protein [Clostridium estertheticum]MBX4265187.1 flagellar biosynthesis protein FlgD [Clostridium estertheticum]WLC90443.1 flagellar biosynthesis protein FlgD [Clostridium estertheticum]